MPDCQASSHLEDKYKDVRMKIQYGKPLTQKKKEEIYEDQITRRTFLGRLTVAAGLVGAGSALSWRGFRYWQGGGILAEKQKPFLLDNYMLKEHPFGRPKLAAVQGKSPARMVRAVLEQLGGPDGMRTFVKPGDVVAIKPNVGFGQRPETGATTHPGIVGEVVRQCIAAGAKEVRVIDNPIEQYEKCFNDSGVREAALKAGARVLQPTENDFKDTLIPRPHILKPSWPIFYKAFEGANKVIGLPIAKDHNLCVATMAMKNWYGSLGGPRNQLHQDIHGSIVDLATLVRPTLVILDATRIMMKFGPTGGDPAYCAPTNTIVAGVDQVGIDAFTIRLFKKADPTDRKHTEEACKYIGMGHAEGLGNKNWKELNPDLDVKDIPSVG